MPYLLMFNKQAQSMLLRSFSHPILKYKPSTILLCSLFLFFFSWFFLLLLFPFSSFSACYAPYFSSTGTQPGKYWFTFSAILFEMFLKSGLQCMSSIMRADRSQNSVDRKSYDWWLERQIWALTCRIRPLHGTTILVKKATLDFCWERQLLDILWQRTLETTTHSDSTPVFQGQCQNSSVFCWHTAFGFRSSFHQQPSSSRPVITLENHGRVTFDVSDNSLWVPHEDAAKNWGAPRSKNCWHEPRVICEEVHASVGIHFVQEDLHMRMAVELDCIPQDLFEPRTARIQFVTKSAKALHNRRNDLPEELGRAKNFGTNWQAGNWRRWRWLIWRQKVVNRPQRADRHF